ncbi:MAG TPA: hypothetical protein VLK28_06115, partial [Methylomirabilota bacterium]|nr:hypothetical protein [Methylomirabilota bacterium]
MIQSSLSSLCRVTYSAVTGQQPKDRSMPIRFSIARPFRASQEVALWTRRLVRVSVRRCRVLASSFEARADRDGHARVDEADIRIGVAPPKLYTLYRAAAWKPILLVA